MEPKTKIVEEILPSKKMDKLRSIGILRQSGKSLESVLKKKRKATVGMICRKKAFKPGMKD